MGKVKEYDKRQQLLNEIDKRDERIMELENKIIKPEVVFKEKDNKTVLNKPKRTITIDWKEEEVSFHELYYKFDDVFDLVQILTDELQSQAWKGEDEDFGK
tara:strand:+ start:574 stop:876 length:303 start_codon:yes stop_codon:yes gene_type:complete